MPEIPPLVIVGAGGLGREVAALVEEKNDQSPTWNLLGFVDDDEALHHTSVMGYSVLGDVDWLSRRENVAFCIAIGDGRVRQKIARRLADTSVHPATLVHPSVSIHRTTDIGPGTILCNGAAPTVNLQIGSHVVLDQRCTVGHDSTLRSFVTLRPGVHVSGSVHLETGVSMGAGSIALPNTRIGAHSTVGAGAVVTNDLSAHCTAVGVPAQPLS